MSTLGDEVAASAEENYAAGKELAEKHHQAIADQQAAADASPNPVPAEKRPI